MSNIIKKGPEVLKRIEKELASADCAPVPSSASAHGIDVAHQWLKKSREEANGPISQWTTDEMDRYHTDLELLVDFVTDCWPNVCVSDGPAR